MFVNSYAIPIKGGNAWRRVRRCFWALLFLASTLVLLYGALQFFPKKVLPEFIVEADNSYILPVYNAIKDLIPLPYGRGVLVFAVCALLWLFSAWAFLRLGRTRMILCHTNIGETVFSCKVGQRFDLLALYAFDGEGNFAVPELWFCDPEMTDAAKFSRAMPGKNLILFGYIEEELEEAETSAEALPEEAPAPAPVVTKAVQGEPEIQIILREAEAKAAKAAPQSAPAPAEPAVEATPAPAPAAPAALAPTPAPVASAPAASEEDDAEDEEETEIREVTVDGKTFRMVIRYSRSFLARVIQAPDTLKSYYSEIKNEILSYENVKSRISWKHDAFNSGRNQLVKLVVRGKNLCVYLALDPNAYEREKYHQVDKGDRNAYAKVPMMVRVKSDLGLRKAKFLISEVMANVGLAKEAEQTVDYIAAYPYRDTKQLVEEKLIKELETPVE